MNAEIDQKLAAEFGTEVPRPSLRRVGDWLQSSNIRVPESNVLVVGTNGKGTVASAISQLHQATGYSTLLFTSPHFVTVRERVRFSGRMAETEDWIRALNALSNGQDPFSWFEATFVLALLLNNTQHTDLGVWEAGLGGRLDAVNILPDVVLTVLTGIGLDHREWLGETEEEIITEKMAVGRRGIPFVAGDLSPPLMERAKDLAKNCRAELLTASEPLPFEWEALYAKWKDMCHPVVRINLRTVLWSMVALDRCQPDELIEPPQPLPGRWMPLADGAVYDAGHNRQAAEQAADMMQNSGDRWVVCYGLLKRKDAAELVKGFSKAQAAIANWCPMGSGDEWHSAKYLRDVLIAEGVSENTVLAHLPDNLGLRVLYFGSFRLHEILPARVAKILITACDSLDHGLSGCYNKERKETQQ